MARGFTKWDSLKGWPRWAWCCIGGRGHDIKKGNALGQAKVGKGKGAKGGNTKGIFPGIMSRGYKGENPKRGGHSVVKPRWA